MHRALWLAITALAMLSAACSGDAGDSAPADTSPLTAAELGWIRQYSAWTIELYGDEDASDSGEAAVDDCRARLEAIGDPPTERLEAAANRSAEVCPFLQEPGMRRRALDLVDQADDLLLPYFRDEQPLEHRTRVADVSHADTALSALATELVERPVEVRCWSDSDWRRVVDEDDAWNDDTTDPDELVGWSDDSVDRIQLVLDACTTMARVAAEGVDTWSRDERIDAADAIETLSHEIQHFVKPDAEESEIECTAIRSLPEFARRFGLTVAEAAVLTELYRSEIYPTLDAEYREGGCPPER